MPLCCCKQDTVTKLLFLINKKKEEISARTSWFFFLNGLFKELMHNHEWSHNHIEPFTNLRAIGPGKWMNKFTHINAYGKHFTCQWPATVFTRSEEKAWKQSSIYPFFFYYCPIFLEFNLLQMCSTLNVFRLSTFSLSCHFKWFASKIQQRGPSKNWWQHKPLSQWWMRRRRRRYIKNYWVMRQK